MHMDQIEQTSKLEATGIKVLMTKLQSTVLFFIIISTIDETDCTSLDIAVAFARYAGALFTFEEVIDIMPDVNKPLDNIADALRLSPLALAMANEFAYNLSTTLTTIAFDLIIFGYLIPSAIIILITILSCWYIREEIRNLYIMLVPEQEKNAGTETQAKSSITQAQT
ncbi:hypothetical protein DINM_005813 [Dirofilaria immitis]|nr:hypothetical protein [Dirofilaria immitis]